MKNREARQVMDNKQSMESGEGNDQTSQTSGQGIVSHRSDGAPQIDQNQDQMSSGASSRKHSEAGVGGFGHDLGGAGAGSGSGFQPALQQAQQQSNNNIHGSVRSTSASGFQQIPNDFNYPSGHAAAAAAAYNPVVSREGSLVTIPPTVTASQPSSAGFEFGSNISQMTWSPAQAYGNIPPIAHGSGADVIPGQWQPHPTPLSASPVVYRNSGQWTGAGAMDVPQSHGHVQNGGHGGSSAPHSKDMAFAVVAVGASPHRTLIDTLGNTAPVHDRRSFETMLSQQRTTNSGGEMRLKTEPMEWIPTNSATHLPPRNSYGGGTTLSRDPSPRTSSEALRAPA